MTDLITIERKIITEEFTMGILTFGGFQCFTLEDPIRDIKVPDKTAIPSGTYSLDFRTDSPMAARYADKYPDHPGMMWLRGVENFEWVYIHVGNTVNDSSGCILVGEGANIKSGILTHSGNAYKQLYPLITKAARDNDTMRIVVTE